MIRRMTVACVALVALVALLGATDAVAKKKKPKPLVGPYVGATSNGIPLSVTLDPGRATGSITYCAMTATFSTSGGVSAKSFAVDYTDPISADTISATGFFSGKKRFVSGTIGPNGCDATTQSYFIQR
jgi:hypothetical protein